METSFQPFSSALTEAWESVSNRQDDTAAWRSGIPRSILGRMRQESVRLPGDRKGTGVRKLDRAGPRTTSPRGSGSSWYAGHRGYTVFTQDRGDEAAAALAAMFADIVRRTG